MGRGANERRPRTNRTKARGKETRRGERGRKGEKRVFHLPFSIRSSPTSGGRWMINASVIISLQIFSDEAYANAWLIASPVHHFFNNTFLMAFRHVPPPVSHLIAAVYPPQLYVVLSNPFITAALALLFSMPAFITAGLKRKPASPLLNAQFSIILFHQSLLVPPLFLLSLRFLLRSMRK